MVACGVQVLSAVSKTDDSLLLGAANGLDALARDYGVVCHTAGVAYHTVK